MVLQRTDSRLSSNDNSRGRERLTMRTMDDGDDNSGTRYSDDASRSSYYSNENMKEKKNTTLDGFLSKTHVKETRSFDKRTFATTPGRFYEKKNINTNTQFSGFDSYQLKVSPRTPLNSNVRPKLHASKSKESFSDGTGERKKSNATSFSSVPRSPSSSKRNSDRPPILKKNSLALSNATGSSGSSRKLPPNLTSGTSRSTEDASSHNDKSLVHLEWQKIAVKAISFIDATPEEKDLVSVAIIRALSKVGSQSKKDLGMQDVVSDAAVNASDYVLKITKGNKKLAVLAAKAVLQAGCLKGDAKKHGLISRSSSTTGRNSDEKSFVNMHSKAETKSTKETLSIHGLIKDLEEKNSQLKDTVKSLRESSAENYEEFEKALLNLKSRESNIQNSYTSADSTVENVRKPESPVLQSEPQQSFGLPSFSSVVPSEGSEFVVSATSTINEEIFRRTSYPDKSSASKEKKSLNMVLDNSSSSLLFPFDSFLKKEESTPPDTQFSPLIESSISKGEKTFQSDTNESPEDVVIDINNQTNDNVENICKVKISHTSCRIFDADATSETYDVSGFQENNWKKHVSTNERIHTKTDRFVERVIDTRNPNLRDDDSMQIVLEQLQESTREKKSRKHPSHNSQSSDERKAKETAEHKTDKQKGHHQHSSTLEDNLTPISEATKESPESEKFSTVEKTSSKSTGSRKKESGDKKVFRPLNDFLRPPVAKSFGSANKRDKIPKSHLKTFRRNDFETGSVEVWQDGSDEVTSFCDSARHTVIEKVKSKGRRITKPPLDVNIIIHSPSSQSNAVSQIGESNAMQHMYGISHTYSSSYFNYSKSKQDDRVLDFPDFSIAEEQGSRDFEEHFMHERVPNLSKARDYGSVTVNSDSSFQRRSKESKNGRGVKVIDHNDDISVIELNPKEAEVFLFEGEEAAGKGNTAIKVSVSPTAGSRSAVNVVVQDAKKRSLSKKVLGQVQNKVRGVMNVRGKF